MWQDYIGLFPTVIAAANGFIALLVGQFFKDNPRGRLFLVATAGVLTLCAVGATFYGQSQVIATRIADQEHRHNIRESFGKYISQAEDIQNELPDTSKSYSELVQDYNKWYSDVSGFLEQMGESYVTRFNDASGINTVIPGITLNADSLSLWRRLYVRKIRLEQFSDQFPY
jgi:hypothetical protein